ncbi:MAG TPA: PAS domain-containing protein [Nitriliruptorales bacterium]
MTGPGRPQVSLPAMAQVGAILAADPRSFLSVHDADGTFTFTTSSIDMLTGRQPGDLQGRSLYDIVHPDDVERVRGAHRLSAAPPASVSVRFRLRDVDDAYVEVESRSWGTPDDDGALASFICLTTPAS